MDIHPHLRLFLSARLSRLMVFHHSFIYYFVRPMVFLWSVIPSHPSKHQACSCIWVCKSSSKEVIWGDTWVGATPVRDSKGGSGGEGSGQAGVVRSSLSAQVASAAPRHSWSLASSVRSLLHPPSCCVPQEKATLAIREESPMYT